MVSTSEYAHLDYIRLLMYKHPRKEVANMWKSRTCLVCGKKFYISCQFMLTGRHTGQTCSIDLCDDHATNVGGKDKMYYCPFHLSLARRTAYDH